MLHRVLLQERCCWCSCNCRQAICVFQRIKHFPRPEAVRVCVCAVQVPLRLCSACKSMANLKDSPQQQTSIQDWKKENSSNCRLVALQTLQAFLSNNFCLQDSTFVDAPTTISIAHDSLLASLQQQVEQSGLLEVLPDLLTAASSAFRATTDQRLDMPAAGTGRAAEYHLPGLELRGVLNVDHVFTAKALLQVQAQLLGLWKTGADSMAELGDSLVNALELAHTVLQGSGRLLVQWEAPAQSAGTSFKSQFLNTAFNAQHEALEYVLKVAYELALTLENQERKAVSAKHLLEFPHLVPCVAIV